jgi:hypothetical protein
MPPFIQCSNTFCTGRADKLGDLCADCKKAAEDQKRKEKTSRWLWAGFPKSVDNHRRGYRPAEDK